VRRKRQELEEKQVRRTTKVRRTYHKENIFGGLEYFLPAHAPVEDVVISIGVEFHFSGRHYITSVPGFLDVFLRCQALAKCLAPYFFFSVFVNLGGAGDLMPFCCIHAAI
jgi:hypothetical protein